MQRPEKISIAGRHRYADVREDVGDDRDYLYRPPLIPLRSELIPERDHEWWQSGRIRDQGSEPSCTGHALASIVDHLRARDLAETNGGDVSALDRPWASARMLYSVARYHDNWPGEGYRGSSIRGVLKGFYYNGVCSIDVERKAQETSGEGPGNQGPGSDGSSGKDSAFGWHMTRAILESARKVQLGAYYRVRPRLSDIHVALNDIGLILASARIHKGWNAASGVIPFHARRDTDIIGAHAFIIVGYDEDGFLVQNSWGNGWGKKGLAHWRYEDWAENVIDLWVLRLGAPLGVRGSGTGRPEVARNALALLRRTQFEQRQRPSDAAPSRLEVLGHIVPLAKGRLDNFGSYHTNEKTLLESAHIIRNGKRNYRHVLIHAMELQEDEIEAATLIRDRATSLKELGCYPIFVTLETVLSAEIFASCRRIVERLNKRAGPETSTEKDQDIEGETSLVALRLLDEVRESTKETVGRFSYNGGDYGDWVRGEAADLLNYLYDFQSEKHRSGNMSYHFSAHGFGAVFLAAIFENRQFFEACPVISSVHLLAPLITGACFKKSFIPCTAHPKDGPIRRMAKLEMMELESVAISALNAHLMAEDRFFAGLWRLLANALVANHGHRTPARTCRRRYHLGR